MYGFLLLLVVKWWSESLYTRMVKPSVKDLKSFGGNTVRVQVPLSPVLRNRIKWLKYAVFVCFRGSDQTGIL